MAKGQLWVKKNNIWLPTIHREGEESSYRWESSEWSECTVECGGGIQERDVWCRDITTNETVSDNLCELAWGPKPAEIQDCNIEPCFIFQYSGTSLALIPETFVWHVDYGHTGNINKLINIIQVIVAGQEIYNTNLSNATEALNIFNVVGTDGKIYYRGNLRYSNVNSTRGYNYYEVGYYE